MDKRGKIIVILGILILLSIILMVAGSILNRDEVQPRLQSAIANNAAITAMGEIALEKTSDYELRVATSNLLLTSASESQSFTTYYTARYGKPGAPATTATLTELEEMNPGSQFDSLYRSSMAEALERNLTILPTLKNEADDPEFAAAVEMAIANQTAHLEAVR